jgi:hypothetical protein
MVDTRTKRDVHHHPGHRKEPTMLNAREIAHLSDDDLNIEMVNAFEFGENAYGEILAAELADRITMYGTEFLNDFFGPIN